MNTDQRGKSGDRLKRIRRRAYELWEEEGRPAGREQAHWDEAAELVAIEDNQALTTEQVAGAADLGPSGEPVEQIAAVRNLGEFPTLTDQGEQTYPPQRAVADRSRKGVAKRATGAAKRAASESKRPVAPKKDSADGTAPRGPRR